MAAMRSAQEPGLGPAALVEFAEELARIAACGLGVRALGEHLARCAGISVLVEDAQWQRLTASGEHAAPATVRDLLEDCGEGSYCALKQGQSGRSIALHAGQAVLGRLSVFGPADLQALEFVVRLTAAAIAVEISREHAALPGRRRAFWERLSQAGYLDADSARDDARARGIAISGDYVVVALAFEGEEAVKSAQPLQNAVLEALKSSSGEVGLLDRASALLFFVPAPREVDAANARTAACLLPRTFAKRHPALQFAGGVGNRVGLMHVRQSVAQAHAALTIARKLYGNGRIGVYADLGAYPLLFEGADRAALRDFSARALLPLREYDEKHQTELERTLRLYFELGENVKTAADRLSVHRHTVFYRLRQIGELCRCKLSDPHDQLTLRMAIAIDALGY